MCVYLSPDLLAEMSPQLQERMQGKSCFNFTRVRRPRLARDAAAVSAHSDTATQRHSDTAKDLGCLDTQEASLCRR